MGKKNSIIWYMLSDEEFSDLVKRSNTYGEIFKAFGLTNKGGNHKTLKSRISKLGISTEHLKPNYSIISEMSRKKKIPLSEILVCGSKYNRADLKSRLLKDGLIKNECSICGQGSIWNNKSIIMVLDHINGNSKDNRMENLRMVCPNCNSQTETFAGRNNKREKIEFICHKCGNKMSRYSKTCNKCSYILRRKVTNHPDKETLQKMISELSWCAIGRKFGVSDNTVRKWARKYDLITENRLRSG